MAIIDDIKQVLGNLGLSTLGFGSPQLAVHWTNPDTGTLTEGPITSMSLQAGSTLTWLAPVGGIFTLNGGTEQIVLPDGSTAGPNTSVLRMHPQIYLRLTRLYATGLEGKNTGTHLASRPVPYFFVYSNSTNTSSPAPKSGKYIAGTSLGIRGGSLSIHDAKGYPIDPVAVAAAFNALISAYSPLEAKDLLERAATLENQRQIFHISQLGNSEVTVRTINLFGEPYENDNLSNLNTLSSNIGFRTITNRTQPIRITNGDSEDRIGLASNGTLGTSLRLPDLPDDISLARDFFSVYVVDLEETLIGQRPSSDDASGVEPRPDIRHNEAITFSFNGNEALGKIHAFLDDSPTEKLVVSPQIANDFLLPSSGNFQDAQWPLFPPDSSPLPTEPIPIPASPVAHFVQNTVSDVVLVLSGLTVGDSVRVYERLFLPDAREGRGDGAGNIARTVSVDGSTETKAAFLLKDPFRLEKSDSSVALPTNPTLHVDVVVVNRTGKKRMFGNVVATVGAQAPLSTTELNLLGSESNLFDDTSAQSLSPVGILGLDTGNVPENNLLNTYDADEVRDIVLALGSDGPPRQAYRLPSMMRRETLVCSLKTDTWNASLSATPLVKDARNARSKIGSPGSPGGKEYDYISVETSGGRLAYDIARIALRRVRTIDSRLGELADNKWNEPAASLRGSISGAILYNVAPIVETPQFMPNEESLTASNLPDNWTAIVDDIASNSSSLLPKLPNSFRTTLRNQLNSLRNSSAGNRLRDEFIHSFSSSVHGRRDSLWTLRNALSKARRLIYIESPAIHAHGLDLIEAIGDRLRQIPGLKIVIALSKRSDYDLSYRAFSAWEYVKRSEAINALTGIDSSRVLAFHPMGIPGRPLRLTSQVVIIDDLWAMIGSSTMRRRGFTFDSGADLVFTDTNIETGISHQVMNLRRRLMSRFIGVEAPATVQEMPSANWIKLADAWQSFDVFHMMLNEGGVGHIESLWDGNIEGLPDVATLPKPSDEVANPEGRHANDPDNYQKLVEIMNYLNVGGLAP